MIRFIGITAAVIICLNLVALLLTFFRVWSISNIYLGLITVYFVVMVIITSPKFSFTLGGERREISIPVWPGPAFFRFALMCSVVLSIAWAFLGEDFIDSLHIKKSVFFNMVSNELDSDIFQSKLFILNDGVYYDENLIEIGQINAPREVLLKKKISLSKANEKMALVVFKNKQGNYVKGVEAYVPLSALKKSEIHKESSTRDLTRENDLKTRKIVSAPALKKPDSRRNLEKERQRKKQQQAAADKRREDERKARQKEQALIAHRENIAQELRQLLAVSDDMGGWRPETAWTQELRGKEIVVYFRENNLHLAAKIIKRIEKTGGRTAYVLLGNDNSCPCPKSEICYSFQHLDEATALQAAIFDIMPTGMLSSSQTRGRLFINLGG